ncbi:uncharacterized protein [Elaeis guineensis]|uniref:E3 ubiquitin-protein ligase RZF1-like n=1 Tax=Elaeis guineensis var. tenera TaxID=51953 RepID=A0A6J0PI09_ELAGV|nr:E3 ubiquitin-protein ligase RZF1-like [Elaeis guineensis]
MGRRNLVHGNTTLHLNAFFSEAGGYPIGGHGVEVGLQISRPYFRQPNLVPSYSDVFSFLFPLSHILSNRHRDDRVQHMVSLVEHPDHDDVQFWNRRISSFALQAARAAVHGGHTDFLMDIGIVIRGVPEFMDEASFLSSDEYVAAETMHHIVMVSSGGRGGFGGVPASRASINALQTRRFEGVQEHESRLQCVICLENFEAGVEVTMMPCSHEFHHTCLSQWLELSHLCPVCRYSMPTMD